VTADENRRIEVFERELWRIAVEHLDYGEQVQWAALAGARVAPAGWRRARAMLHFDQGGELKRTFLITAVDRNKNAQLRLRALQEIAASRDAEAFDRALDFVESWPRDDKREGVKVVLQALAEKKIGRRDQANNWIWRCANMTREVHEEYAVQRWPETKRLLGLLVNSSGGAHARNARRLVHAARQQDRRLSAALLAAAIPHTAEASEVVNGARTRMSRKPAALARELLRNFPKGKGRRGSRRRKKKGAAEGVAPEAVTVEATGVVVDETTPAPAPAPRRSRRKPVTAESSDSPLLAAAAAVEAAARGTADDDTAEAAPRTPRRRTAKKSDGEEPPRATRRRAAKSVDDSASPAAEATRPASKEAAASPVDDSASPATKTTRRRASKEAAASPVGDSAPPAAKTTRRRAVKSDEEAAPETTRRRSVKSNDDAAPAATPRRSAKKIEGSVDEPASPAPKTTRRRAVKSDAAAEPKAPRRRATKAEAVPPVDAAPSAEEAAAPKATTRRRATTKAVNAAVEAPAEPAEPSRRRAPANKAVDAAVEGTVKAPVPTDEAA
jgi:ribonuclease E